MSESRKTLDNYANYESAKFLHAIHTDSTVVLIHLKSHAIVKKAIKITHRSINRV